MDDELRRRLRAIWNQRNVPVLLRRQGGRPLALRVPERASTAAWVRGERRRKPIWQLDGRYWEVPRAWFSSLTRQLLDEFDSVYTIQPFRHQQKCAPACWNATGEECECSCMGERHGSSHPGRGWKVISETFATAWNDEELACRLLNESR